jgi:hypothetical protein
VQEDVLEGESSLRSAFTTANPPLQTRRRRRRRFPKRCKTVFPLCSLPSRHPFRSSPKCPPAGLARSVPPQRPGERTPVRKHIHAQGRPPLPRGWLLHPGRPMQTSPADRADRADAHTTAGRARVPGSSAVAARLPQRGPAHAGACPGRSWVPHSAETKREGPRCRLQHRECTIVHCPSSHCPGAAGRTWRNRGPWRNLGNDDGTEMVSG